MALFGALGCHTSSKRRADDVYERGAQLSVPLVFKAPRTFGRK